MSALRLLALVAVAALAACAAAPPAATGSVVPGTIGIAVQRSGDAVVIAALGEDSAAARAGLRVGDRIVRYNGEPISDARQLERLVLDSIPGSRARVEVVRGRESRTFEVPVEQVRTGNRA